MTTSSTISIAYDPPQDRLNLIFTSKKNEQLIGIITRRLFKSLLSEIHTWLSKNTIVARNDSLQADQIAEQHALDQFQHYAAQDNKQTNSDISLNENAKAFLIGTINFSYIKPEKVEVSFISPDQSNNANLVISIEQLHQLIGTMLNKVPDWDLSNPWQEKNDPLNSLPLQNNNFLH